MSFSSGVVVPTPIRFVLVSEYNIVSPELSVIWMSFEAFDGLISKVVALRAPTLNLSLPPVLNCNTESKLLCTLSIKARASPPL